MFAVNVILITASLLLVLIPLNVNVWFEPEVVTFVVKSSMSKTSPAFNEPPDLGSITAIVKLSVFLAANVPPVTVIEKPPEPTFTVVCLRTCIKSAECVLTQSLGHDAIAAVWSCLNILTLLRVQFAFERAAPFVVKVAAISEVTD